MYRIKKINFKCLKFTNIFQCNKLSNEKEALKLLIKQEDKQENSQKSLVEIEVQTQNIFDVGTMKKKYLICIQLIKYNN